MTDAEIIKALECCSKRTIWEDCPVDCPMYQFDGDCFDLMQKDILDLINRQKAEISVLRKLLDKAETEMNNQSENMKKLTKDCSSMQSTLAKMSMGVEQAKAEAIKEFAERLKAECRQDRYAIQTSTKFGVVDKKYLRVVDESDISNLVKEMVGDAE